MADRQGVGCDVHPVAVGLRLCAFTCLGQHVVYIGVRRGVVEIGVAGVDHGIRDLAEILMQCPGGTVLQQEVLVDQICRGWCRDGDISNDDARKIVCLSQGKRLLLDLEKDVFVAQTSECESNIIAFGRLSSFG